ncbi:PTS sugar transporter subunit IIA [Sporosarcina sp. NPDC096371]|uniref:PTS sugar transporter subunit IIA n=1 Tax=Sporosarcina sp. NPDC096371 TaxID=3364530 RepID=UPI0038206DA9
MYQLLLIGHGKFPSGVQSALHYLMGENPNISVLELVDGMTHVQFEEEFTNLLQDYAKVLVFADLTGGAPHQIAARIILESTSLEHFLISGMPLSVITELAMKFQFQEVASLDAPMIIEQALSECKDLMVNLAVERGKI